MKKDFCLRLGLTGLFFMFLGVCNERSLIGASGDSHWDRQFGLPGVTNRVYALRFNGDKLYASGTAVGVGGQFSPSASSPAV